MSNAFFKISRFRIFFMIVVGVLFTWSFLYSFLSHRVIKYSQARVLLGTLVQIHICAAPQEKHTVLQAFDQAWKRLEEINTRINVYNEQSDIAAINRSYPHPIKVHRDVYELLALSKRYHALTQGAFDITIWPLIVLWKEAQTKQALPLPGDIKWAKEAMGVDKIKLLADHYVQLMHARTRIDLSAIGQGYAADEAAAILRKEGMKNFLIDAGGEVMAQGLNDKGRPWSVGVKDPLQPMQMIDIIPVADRAVSTSGDYEKYYEINQKKYSHIIDPVTGYPTNSVVSATVVCSNATEADVFSTVLCVLGKQGIKLLESLSPGVAMAVIEQNLDQATSLYQNNAYQVMTR